MEVSIVVYRAAIGMFNNRKCRLNIKSSVLQIWTRHRWGLCILLIIFLSILLIMAGDIELNPGPKMSCLTIGHINARSLFNEEKFEEMSSLFWTRALIYSRYLKLGLTIIVLMNLYTFQAIILSLEKTGLVCVVAVLLYT